MSTKDISSGEIFWWVGELKAAMSANWILCEAGKMRLAKTVPGEDWSMVFFEILAGKRFHVIKLPISKEIEATLIEELRELLGKQL